MKKSFLFALSALLLLTAAAPNVYPIRNSYSHKNSHRGYLSQHQYIVLHTTEGGWVGALETLKLKGAAHYLVTRDGQIIRIIDENKVAAHAGISSWNNRKFANRFSLGIEVEGYAGRALSSTQEKALRYLVTHLKNKYGISDDHVVTHSMIAYGYNKDVHANVRGRKPCGYQFADPKLRARLGLGLGPKRDLEVERGTLAVIDHVLFNTLFRAPFGLGPQVLRASYAPSVERAPRVTRVSKSKASPVESTAAVAQYVAPDDNLHEDDPSTGYAMAVASASAESHDDSPKLETIGLDGNTAYAIASRGYNQSSTIYFLLDGRVRTGDQLTASELDRLPRGTRMLVGYVDGGKVSAKRSAYSIVKNEWNSPTTYYVFPNRDRRNLKIVTGDDVDVDKIPAGTMIFFNL